MRRSAPATVRSLLILVACGWQSLSQAAEVAEAQLQGQPQASPATHHPPGRRRPRRVITAEGFRVALMRSRPGHSVR